MAGIYFKKLWKVFNNFWSYHLIIRSQIEYHYQGARSIYVAKLTACLYKLCWQCKSTLSCMFEFSLAWLKNFQWKSMSHIDPLHYVTPHRVIKHVILNGFMVPTANLHFCKFLGGRDRDDPMTFKPEGHEQPWAKQRLNFWYNGEQMSYLDTCWYQCKRMLALTWDKKWTKLFFWYIQFVSKHIKRDKDYAVWGQGGECLLAIVGHAACREYFEAQFFLEFWMEGYAWRSCNSQW